MFSLSWTLMHIIDETSAFRDMTPDKFTGVEGALVLNVGGVDDNSAQRLYARQIYSRQTSAGSTAIATSPACRSGAACCSTTPNSTRSTRRRCERSVARSLGGAYEYRSNVTHLHSPWVAMQGKMRSVGIPRSFEAAAIARRLRQPAACNSQ